MKALNRDFYNQFSERLFQSLMSDEELSINLAAEDTIFSRFSKARIRQVTEVEQAYVNLNFIKGNKTIALSLKYSGDVETDFNFVHQKIKEARDYLNVVPDDPYLVRPQNYGNSQLESVHGELSGEEMMDMIAEKSMGVDLAGVLLAGELVRASSNSKGQNHWFKTQNFALDYSLYNTRQKAVKSLYAGLSFEPIELAKNIDEAKAKLELMGIEPRKMPRGAYRVYLAPSAVSELLGTLSWGGVSMSAHQRGQGSLKALWKGEKKLSPLFSLSESFEINLSPRFNDSGEVAPMHLSIIEKGEFKNFLTSTRTANEFKVETNFASDWESLRSPVINAGNIAEEDILKELGTGLYISDLHYLNWSDRESARITGMTRYACFYVENGKLVAPIEDLRFDESYYHILGSGLLGLTKNTYITPRTGSYFEREIGGMQVPGMIVDQFKFTL
jgi:predicted Zn-dependent protease